MDKLYIEATLNKTTESDLHRAATKVKVTSGGSSFRLEQVPEGNGLDSPGECKETCDSIREGSTHATFVISAPDNSVNAIVLHDDSPEQSIR